jgi:hypothetical protein
VRIPGAGFNLYSKDAGSRWSVVLIVPAVIANHAAFMLVLIA